MQEILDNRERRQGANVSNPQNMTAVIDIGSNSVRLVVLDGPSRVKMPKINEKDR